MSPGEKLARVFELIEEHCERTRVAMRAKYPDASDDEIFLRCGVVYIGRALMIRAYGWDPDLPADSQQPYSLKSAIAEARWRSRANSDLSRIVPNERSVGNPTVSVDK